MSIPVMILVLFAALLHASWNFFVKKTDDKYVSMSAVVLGHMPFALATGCFIASYSLVDGMGARQAGTALGFYGCLSLLNGVLFAVIMRGIWPGTVSLTVRRNLKKTLVAGGASFAAYAIVTWAFTVAPIPLVTALRETSIIFALILGVFLLKERLDLMKIAATVFTLVGVALLRMG